MVTVKETLDSGIAPITLDFSEIKFFESNSKIIRTFITVNSLDLGVLTYRQYRFVARRTKIGNRLVKRHLEIMTVPITNITKTITVETTTFYDTNLVTEVKTKTVIKKTTEQSGNTKTETYYVYHTATENGQEVTKTYGPYATLPDLFKLCKFTVDPDGAPQKGEFNNVLLNAQYAVSDTSKFALDFTYTPTGQGGATSQSYAISATNKTDSGVRLAIALTSFGVTKGITYKFNETPITTTAPLVVTVEKETAAN